MVELLCLAFLDGLKMAVFYGRKMAQIIRR